MSTLNSVLGVNDIKEQITTGHALFKRICQRAEDLRLPYTVIEHSAVFTMEQAIAEVPYPMDQQVKVLFDRAYTSTTRFTFRLVAWTGSERVDFAQLAKVIRATKVTLATPEDVKSQLHIEIGAMAPFGYDQTWAIVVDSRLLEQENLCINPGLHDKTLVIRSQTFNELLKDSSQTITVI